MPAASPATYRRASAAVLRPTTTAVSPITVSQRPSRGTRRPAMIAEVATPSANGVTANPERKGE